MDIFIYTEENICANLNDNKVIGWILVWYE
jgi:hypothetical protein